MILAPQARLFGPPSVIGWTVSGITVRVEDKAEVDEWIRRLHYSRSVVWSSNFHLLVYADERPIGAMQFGPAMNPASGGRIVTGATVTDWIELNRMAFVEDRPIDTGTRALSAAIRLLRHMRPGIEWIQSFADERCVKLGGVYQAASFLYCGEHRATFYELDGEWFHKSAWNRAQVDKRGWGCGPKLEYFNLHKDRATATSFRQFRYIRCLTRRARKHLRLPILPYPKVSPTLDLPTV